MPVKSKPDGTVLVCLGHGDVTVESHGVNPTDDGGSQFGALTFRGDDGRTAAVAIPDAATAFSLMNLLRDMVYELGGVDPCMEACDEVAEYLDCAEAADWKDAKGRLTRRCSEALNRLDPRKRT